MTTEQYCLRWNDHRSILLSNFERLLQNNTSVDCTLAAEGQYLRAHKVVLSACSPYFEVLLNQEKEKHPIIFMKDVRFQDLKAIMLYMYRGEVVIPHDQLAALLQAAESLQIKGLGCGDKAPTANVNEGLNQQQSIIPQTKSLQQPVQPVRQQPPSRVSESHRESGPQVVDLTDEKPSNAVKRSVPQTTVRQKRPAYSPGSAPFQSQNASPVTTSNQISVVRASLPAQNLPSTSVSPSQPVNRSLFQSNWPANEVSVGNTYVPSQITATKRTESPDTRDPVKQAVAFKAISRASLPPTQKRVVQSNIPQTIPVQKNVQSPLPSKTSTPPNAENTSLIFPEKTAPKHVVAKDCTGDKQQPELNCAIPMSEAPTTARQSPGMKTIMPCIEKVAETASAENSLSGPSTEQEKSADLDKSICESQNESSTAENVPLDQPGPSGKKSSPAKPGRRRKTAAECRYSCPECDKRFSLKGRLEKHLRIHDGDAYQCDVCDKMFLSRSALIKHVRSHSVQPSPPTQHKCQLCGSTFVESSDLEKHLTEHTLTIAKDD